MSGLPQVIAEIAEAAGPDAAWALARAKGGQLVFIPATMKADHWLIAIVGVEAARKICDHFSTNGRGDQVLIPMASNAKAASLIREALDQGKNANEAAAIAGVHRRTVLRHKKRSTDDRQGNLFE